MAFPSDSLHSARESENRFARITTNDHSAPLWIATILSLIYAVLVLAVRLGFTKWKAHTLDDIVVTIAHLIGFTMWGLLFTSLDNGLGKSYAILHDAEVSRMQQYFFTSQILLYIALALSKCSILILIRAVFTQNSKVSFLALATMIVVAIWGFIGVVASSVACSVESIVPRPGGGYCTSLVPWLRVLGAGDVLTETLIIIIPMVGFHGSLMSNKRKAIVMLAFSTRIPNIVFAIMHLITHSKFIDSHQPAMSIVPTAAWQSVLLSYNLMSATSPLLKGFTEGFMTAGTSLGYVQEGATTGGGSGTLGSYELRSLTKTKSRVRGSPSDATKSQPRAAQVQWNT
ncbi:unnamed protein product [Alternaria burnsii]|nr:unnamed protein product [Alternaria burnsii]